MSIKWHCIGNNFTNYYVSMTGEVINIATGKILKSTNHYGYNIVTIYDNEGKRHKCRVARLVAEAFVQNPNKFPQVNHKDRNRSNDAYTNLEWCTAQYNAEYSGRKVEAFTDDRHIGIFPSMTKAGIELGYSQQLVYAKCTSGTPTRQGIYFRYLR